jgi:hypothetical protein
MRVAGHPLARRLRRCRLSRRQLVHLGPLEHEHGAEERLSLARLLAGPGGRRLSDRRVVGCKPEGQGQALADQQWRTVQEEDHQNKELLELSKQILHLTKEVRTLTDPHSSDSPSGSPDSARK